MECSDRFMVAICPPWLLGALSIRWHVKKKAVPGVFWAGSEKSSLLPWRRNPGSRRPEHCKVLIAWLESDGNVPTVLTIDFSSRVSMSPTRKT